MPFLVVIFTVIIIFDPSIALTQKLTVLFQNDHLAVVNKPALVPCHFPEIRRSGRRRVVKQPPEQAQQTQPRKQQQTNEEEDVVVPVLQRAIRTFPGKQIHLVHRLDAPTSGCLLLAFSSDAARQLSKDLADNQFSKKTYYALCRGDGAYLRQKETFMAQGDVKDSRGIYRSAQTEITGLWGSNGHPRRCCLVRAEPFTGRYHQIRQHLARENYPIVGETRHHPDRTENKAWKEILSSPETNIIPRLCLHCHRIQIPSSNNNENPFLPHNGGLDVSCPLPSDMRTIIDMTEWAEEARNSLPELF